MKLIPRALNLFTQGMLLLLLTTACSQYPVSYANDLCKIDEIFDSIKKVDASGVIALPFAVNLSPLQHYLVYPVSFLPKEEILKDTCSYRFKSFEVSPVFDTGVSSSSGVRQNDSLPIVSGNSSSFRIYLPTTEIKPYTIYGHKFLLRSNVNYARGRGIIDVTGDLVQGVIRVELEGQLNFGANYNNKDHNPENTASWRHWFIDEDDLPAVLLCSKDCKEELASSESVAISINNSNDQNAVEPLKADWQKQLSVTVIYKGTNIPDKKLTCEQLLGLAAVAEKEQLLKTKKVTSNGIPTWDCKKGTITIPVKSKLKRAKSVKSKIKGVSSSCQPVLRYYQTPNGNITREINLVSENNSDIFVMTDKDDIDLDSNGELELAFKEDADCMFDPSNSPKKTVEAIPEDGRPTFDVTAYSTKPSLHVVLALGGIPTTMVTDDDMGKLVGAILEGLRQSVDEYADVNLYLDQQFDEKLTPYKVFNTKEPIPAKEQQLVDLMSTIMEQRKKKPITFSVDINLSPFIKYVVEKYPTPMKPPAFLFIGRRNVASNGICGGLSALNSIENNPKPLTTIVEFYDSTPKELGVFGNSTTVSAVTSATSELSPIPKSMQEEYGNFSLFQCSDIKRTDSLQPFIVNWDGRNVVLWSTQAIKAVSELVKPVAN